ncbi:MAG: hypothetical protein HYY65_14600 [Candidatus Tectomicrobia bacterium]|uniref:Response regulatory domain-containing protein n=1 Tax=Tectimicrobiota bacterium TaxID=2528274 RepID=A0A932M280_UNCTE|nr:hypothetical protein [Candidatus Tectomicrobia bacterium]
MKTDLKEKAGAPADFIPSKAVRPVPKNLRFLVAYENPSVCRTIASTLKDMGFSYIEVRGETENLYKILKADGISCLICGTKAMERNRQELFRMIRSDEDLKHLILVVVDGGSKKEKVLEAPPAGLDVYISVPFSIRHFEERIRKILVEKSPGNRAA